MSDIQVGLAHARRRERLHHQALDLDVAFDPGMAVELRADLQRFARAVHAARQRLQHAARIAQARDSLAVEQMGVDACHLRRDVGPHAEHAAGKLVDELEGLQIEVVPRTGEQRFEVLDHRRHHQLEAVHEEQIEDVAPQPFDPRGLLRQDVLDVLGQDPGAHAGFGIQDPGFSRGL
jgi:hypothetical protein